MKKEPLFDTDRLPKSPVVYYKIPEPFIPCYNHNGYTITPPEFKICSQAKTRERFNQNLMPFLEHLINKVWLNSEETCLGLIDYVAVTYRYGDRIEDSGLASSSGDWEGLYSIAILLKPAPLFVKTVIGDTYNV